MISQQELWSIQDALKYQAEMTLWLTQRVKHLADKLHKVELQQHGVHPSADN